MIYEALTHRIIGCAMKVHSVLGNGFQEVIYQRAMSIEMSKQGYYEHQEIGLRRMDFFVEDKIMVELYV